MKIKLRSLIIFPFFLIATSFNNSDKWFNGNLSFNLEGGSNYVTQENPEGIVLSNDIIQLKFLSAESGFGLYSLSNLKTGYDFLEGNAREENLWIIKLRNAYNQDISIDNSVKCDRSYKIDRDPSGGGATLNLFWNGIDIGSEADVIDVQATVRIDRSGLSYWKMDIINKSKMFGNRDAGYGAWVVTYPALRGLKSAKNGNMELAISDRVGRLIKNPADRMPFEMRYPSRISMQFSTLFGTENKSGLYLAAHDPEVYTKTFYYKLDQKDKSLKYEMLNYPEGMGQSANGFSMPYEAVVGVYEGDWITASMIYRKWATKQKWCSKGKLSQRSDFPKWIQNNTLWFAGQRTEKMIPLAKYLDAPVAYHTYDWFDKSTRNDPEYFALDLFPDHVKELHSAGIKIIPYTDARFWSMNAGSWKKENPEPYACKVPYYMIEDFDVSWNNYRDLVMYMEHWGRNKNTVVMCPFTKGWQDEQSELISGLVSQFDVDGVYMDQISSYTPVLCFDPGHGHTLGGGNYWYKGYHKMIEICKENARKIKNDIILTSEDNAECYIDVLDLHLVKSPTDLIPMFHYVYSGYCITYGRVIGAYWSVDEGTVYTKGLPLKMRNAQMFIWGEQMGWFDPNVVDLPSPEAEYIKTLCQALEKDPVKRYLFYGEMVRPPLLRGDNPMLVAQWRPGDPSEDPNIILRGRNTQEMPAVLHSAWKAEDGTLGLVFTNLDNSAHKVSYTVDTKEYQLPQASQNIVTVIHGVDAGNVRRYSSSSITRTENIPPRSVLVLEVESR